MNYYKYDAFISYRHTIRCSGREGFTGCLNPLRFQKHYKIIGKEYNEFSETETGTTTSNLAENITPWNPPSFL